MPRGRWKTSKDQVAQEAYAVLIERKKPTRTYSKSQLAKTLSDPEIYTDFLKLCLEFDDSNNLRALRKGLMHVIKAIGVADTAKASGFSRITAYRMLQPKGNPRLKSVVGLFKTLNLRVWVVDEEFIKTRSRLKRPKDQESMALVMEGLLKKHND